MITDESSTTEKIKASNIVTGDLSLVRKKRAQIIVYY